MKITFILSLVSFLVFQIGCATPPDEIPTSHVSPVQYSHYDCEQITMEMRHVGRRVNELYYELDEEAGDDAAQMGIGLLLFWPALFFLEGGDDARAGECARLKGERIALEDAAVMKNVILQRYRNLKNQSLKKHHHHNIKILH